MTPSRTWDAQWIGAPADLDGGMPIFRRTFVIERLPQRAIAFVCGLGHFELRVNGEKVGDDLLEPGWTNYAKTCLYVEHDATPHFRAGHNTIDVLLGNGMYHVPGGRYRKFKGSFGTPKLLLELTADGVVTVRTNASWQCAAGPITFSCIYGGEDYDARRAEPGEWKPVALVEPPAGQLVPQTSPPSRVMESLKPVRVTERRPGLRVFDMGQNFSGLPKLTAKGSAGAKITLIPAELLDEHGLVHQKPTGSPVTFSYTLRGDATPETWQPRFSLTGFRYLQAEGDLDALLGVEGQFIYASAMQVGEFECSNDLLNRIHRLILAAIKSNLHSVMTDCPHREKLGWLEQTYLMGPSVMANFDVRTLYTKISRDMRDAQRDDGMIPTIAPQYTTFKPPWDIFNDSPEWGSAAVINPWLVYQRYGNRDILEENIDVMQRYVAYLSSRADENGIVDYGLADWYDIGPGDPGFSKLTSAALTATATYIQDLIILREVLITLGQQDEAERLIPHLRKSHGALNEKLFDSTKRVYDRGSQTAQAIPLAMRLVPAEHRAAVLDHLIRDIRGHENHITAGDIGFRYLLAALAEADRSDVIFDLLSRTDAPSYGSQLARGATSLSEAWDANPKSSQNHLMLGHAEAWFYERLAGIQIDFSRAKGEQIVIRPTPVGDVTWARARHESALGEIVVAWERDGDRFKLTLTAPANVRVQLPDQTIASVPAGISTHECWFEGSGGHV
jgi:hypothetical protein